RVRDLAQLVSELTGAKIQYLSNPRREADENEVYVANDKFQGHGLEPVPLRAGLREEIADIARHYADRCDLSKVDCVSYWNAERRVAANARGTADFKDVVKTRRRSARQFAPSNSN